MAPNPVVTRPVATRPAVLRIAAFARAYRRVLIVAVVALVAGLAFEALRLVLREVHLSDVRGALSAIAPGRIALALALTATSYLALTGYDWIALRVIGRPQPWRIAATASFISYTLSHNLGLAMLTGGSARYRVYTAAGLELGDVARVSAIAGAAFWGGIVGAGGLALVLAPDPVPAPRWIGLVLLVVLASLAIARARGVERLTLLGWTLPLPGVAQMGALGALSVFDLAVASAALFVLIPGLDPATYPDFFLAYAVGMVVALVTHVPGGLGVFEAVVLAMVPGERPAVFAGLLLYRIVYYLIPLICAATLAAGLEGARLRRQARGGPIGRGLSLLDRAGRALAPAAVTALVFVGGLVLLVSGALPGVKARLGDLDALVPLPFIEGSHLAGSFVGTALLLIAPALNARLQSGFHAARVLLVGGAIFSLFKGFDYEEAMLLLGIAALLQYCRAGFYRKGALLTEPINLGWLAAAAAAIALSVWAGFFAYKRTAYSDQLWWRFALDANAPRFLRASFAAGILLTATAFWHLLTRASIPRAVEALDPAVAERVLAFAERTDANLAFTGGKRFLVSAAGDAFVMYQVRGRTWVVMGDPVGPRAAWTELAWAIRRACDAARGRLVFYQASEAMLPLFVELGLGAIKYGEEAHVSLAGFTLAGPRAKPLRHGIRRGEAAGLRFEIVAAADVRALLPDLRVVSDAWLDDKGAREKHFSVGAFDADYLARYDLAVLRQGVGDDTRIVAFANIWTSADKAELSVDLMRHVSDAPYGAMDMLFAKLLGWGAEQGYARFNLGMTPLSGITAGQLAPLWAKLGHAVFAHGERLYGFAGLRAFKAKFAPMWVTRYIAAPGGVARARALLDVVRLVNG